MPKIRAEDRKLLKPSKEVQSKMQPMTRRLFDDLLQKAVSAPVRKPAAKHR